jgi:hypothetical protein
LVLFVRRPKPRAFVISPPALYQTAAEVSFGRFAVAIRGMNADPARSLLRWSSCLLIQQIKM